MTLELSDRINAIKPSATVKLSATIQGLRDSGVDVIDMAVGEPDFAVDAGILAATSAALESGHTRYGPAGGLPPLRRRLAAHFEGYDESNIIVTNGAKQALYSVFQVLCSRGAEVIIPTPCWVSFSHQIRLAGGRPILVPTQVDHLPDLEAIEQAVGPRTVALLMNSPNNPTGAVYPSAVVEALAEICQRNKLWLIADEAYHAFDYRGSNHFAPFDIPSLRRQLIVIRSFSKTYAMTGYRVGFAAAPSDVVQAMNRLQSHLSGNVCTFAQHGALAALDLPLDLIAGRRRRFAGRRDRAYALASELFDCQRPEGAFYLLASIRRYAERFKDDIELAAALIDRAHVAVVPGAHFFAPGHVRISFATSSGRMEEGFRRLQEVLWA
jgi:aspartate aminotransferase